MNITYSSNRYNTYIITLYEKKILSDSSYSVAKVSSVFLLAC